LFLLQIGRLFR